MVEAALIKLGTVAVRTAAKLWYGDQKIAAEVTASAVDIISDRLSSHLDKRKFNRMIDKFADEVVKRVEPIIDREFRTLEENERLAAIEAVHDTFSQAPLTDQDLFAADLDARHLDRSLRARVPNQTRDLSADGTALYDLLLRECCGYVIEIARGLPKFSTSALTEILRREQEILDGIRDVLARLPPRDRTAGFGYDYRQLVARKLDQVQMYGVTLSDASRKYPLSVAYISLTAATERDDAVLEESRIDDLLATSDRVFIRGEAGLGKTTLLHWIAVRSALGDFPESLASWNGTVPFFLPLRRYSTGTLPAPESFLEEIGRHIADEMPHGWVHERLRDGRAVVLVDGVDEVIAEKRDTVRSWLSDLVTSFPQSKFVVTSRPGGAPHEWLQDDQFKVVDLQPMTPRDVRIFIERWHEAMRSMTADTEARAEIDSYQLGLLEHLNSRTHIRKLAGYPLLCALLCALHKDRRAALPNNRKELYDVALQMMLERRDSERKITVVSGLNLTEQKLLLGDLAYWLIRNGNSDTEIYRAQERFARRLESMPQVTKTAEQVYHHLLERSGLIREPVEGRVDFVHRTFQEYLAAIAAMTDFDDVGTLVKNAHLDQWHEVVVMAVGCAGRRQREEIFAGLLARSRAEPKHQDTLDLLALASLETAPELDPRLRSEVEDRARDLVPPQTLTAAKSFASAGTFVLDLLANAKPRTVKHTVATIRAIAETGLPEAIPVLAKYRDDPRTGAQAELLRCWGTFEPEEYAKLILRDIRIEEVEVFHDQARFSSLRYLNSLEKLVMTWMSDWDPDLSTIPRSVQTLTLDQHRYLPAKFVGAPPVDISSLKHLTKLASLYLNVIAVVNLKSITRLSNLYYLNIRHGVSSNDLSEVTEDARISHVYLNAIPNLTDLAPLSFLNAVEYLYITNTGPLADISEVARWKDTLTYLVLDPCDVRDFSPVAGLQQLKRLRITGTHILDISPIAELGNLASLDLSGSKVRNLSPLGKLSRLRELILEHPLDHNVSELPAAAAVTYVRDGKVVMTRDPYDR